MASEEGERHVLIRHVSSPLDFLLDMTNQKVGYIDAHVPTLRFLALITSHRPLVIRSTRLSGHNGY